MKNKVKIKGNENFVAQGSRNSKVEFKKNNSLSKSTYTLIGVILAFLGLIITVITGWDSIIKFFMK